MPRKEKVDVRVRRNPAQKNRGAIRLTIEALFDSDDPSSYDAAAAAISRIARTLLTPEERQELHDQMTAVGVLTRTAAP